MNTFWSEQRGQQPPDGRQRCGGGASRYRYSLGGACTYKQVTGADGAPGEAEHYLLDAGAGAALGVVRGGQIAYWNVALPSGEVVGRHEADGARRYYLKDRLGSVRAVVDESGGAVETRDHYPFGLRMPGRGLTTGAPAKEGFTGHELDGETGLLYAGARYLMPALGRWTTVDPLADDFPSVSPYSYSMNNPVNLVDPDGMASCDITLCGKNGSSVTIETDLIDVEVDVSSLPGTDFGGNHSIGGEDVVLAALDVVGVVDPTPTADALAASIYAGRGEVGNTLISAAGFLPLAGDAAKGLRLGKHVDTITGAIRSVDDQAQDLVKLNGGRNRVTMRSQRKRYDIDLAGRSHGGVPTPHTKISDRNYRAPNQPAYNTKSAEVTKATQEELRMVRRYLESKNK